MIQRDSAIPLHYQLFQHLESEILSGAYKVDSKFPTDVELSEKYGVSRPTVRQALGQLVSKGLLARERGRGTFVRPFIGAVSSDKQVVKYHTLGLIMPWGPGTLFAPLLDAIEDVVHDSGFHVLLANHRDDPDREIVRIREMLRRGVDGVLWMCPSRGSNPAMLKTLLKSVPVVVAVDRVSTLEDAKVSLVESDNVGGMKQVVRYLVGKGYRKIACVHESLNLGAGRERVQGYLEALRECGIEPTEDWMFSSRQTYMDNGRLCADKILRSNIEFDAAACTTDSSAIGLIQRLSERKVSVPDDIAVTGFNDELIAIASSPKLTTVHQDVATMGKRAASLVLEQLQQLQRAEVISPTQVTVPVELVVRESA